MRQSIITTDGAPAVQRLLANRAQTPAAPVLFDRPARAEIPALRRRAEQEIGRPLAPLAALHRVHDHDPTSFAVIRAGESVVAAFAFLHLGNVGLDRLRDGSLDLASPASGDLASFGTRPAGIYWWAFFARGVMKVALPLLFADLAARHWERVGMWAIPVTPEGGRCLTRIGFDAYPTTRPGLLHLARDADTANGRH